MQQFHPDSVRLPVRIGSKAIAAGFLLGTMLSGYRYIGWPPVIIVGGSGTAAFVLWSITYPLTDLQAMRNDDDLDASGTQPHPATLAVLTTFHSHRTAANAQFQTKGDE